MTNYQIPFDLSFEDKIIGGKLSLRQAIWLIVPIGIFMVGIQNPDNFYTITENSRVLNITAITMFILFELILFTIASCFSFITVNGMSLDNYLYKVIKYNLNKNKVKHYE
ncbi:MAG: PrgI family protein [Clostridium sp.]